MEGSLQEIVFGEKQGISNHAPCPSPVVSTKPGFSGDALSRPGEGRGAAHPSSIASGGLNTIRFDLMAAIVLPNFGRFRNHLKDY